MIDPNLDNGLPSEWEDIALALSPAPRSDWHVVPPEVSERLQPAMNLLDQRSRVVLALLVDGEKFTSIGDVFGIDEEQVRRIEPHACVLLIGASAPLRRECSAWLRDTTIDGSTIVRFADVRLDLGDWGPVPEATAWRMLLWLMRRQREPYRVVALNDGRHLIMDQDRHRTSRVESWLQRLGRFAEASEVERGTGVPSRLITHAVDAFDGVLATHGGLFISKSLSSVVLAHAVAGQIARHGCREWHYGHLGFLLANLHTERFQKWSLQNFDRLVKRLPPTDFEPSTEPGWWRYRGPVDPILTETRADHEGPAYRVGIGGSSPGEASRKDDGTSAPGAMLPGDRQEDLVHSDTTLEPGELEDRLADAVVSALRDSDAPLTITQLTATTGAEKRYVHKVVFHLLRPRGMVICTDGLRWALAQSDDGPGERNRPT